MRLTPALAIAAALALTGRAEAATAPSELPALDLIRPAFAAQSAGDRFDYQPGQGLVRWSYSEAGAEDAGIGLRLAVASVEAGPALALMRPGADLSGPQRAEVTFVRNWPAALSMQAGRLTFDVTPHAAFGFSSEGAQLAEAGAVLRLGAQLQRSVLHATGADDVLKGSRVFLYAGGSGRAVGLNLLRNQALDARADPYGDGFVREAQAGLGFRRGAVSAAFGYTYEDVTYRSLGDDRRGGGRVGLTLSIRPKG